MTHSGAWPFPGDPADPFADEPLPGDGWEDYRHAGGDLPHAAYLEREQAFRDALADALAGRVADLAPVRAWAGALRIDEAWWHERPRTPDPAIDALPTLADLARVTADLCPTAATEAADRYLGPLADELVPGDPTARHVALTALAAACFSLLDGAGIPDGRTDDPGRSPFEQWCRRRPYPDAAVRARFRAIARAPMGVYSLEARAPGTDTWRVADRLDLAPHAVPDGPVHVPSPACPIRPPRPGDTLVARIVRGPAGWEASCAFVFPSAPPTRRLRTWLALALWEARLRDRRMRVEAFLRDSGHTLCRRVAEWAWLHGDEDPYRDAVLYDLEYAHHVEDLEHYAALAAQSGGPVLELGCGTGRLAIAMARTGVAVDGVDLSPSMLAGLRRRLAELPAQVARRVRGFQADFRLLDLEGRYPLIVWPFNALHHCRGIDEVVAVLERARAHLAPGGLLALDCYLPDVALYDRDPAERAEPRQFVHPDTGETMESWEQGWWEPAQATHHVVYVYVRPDGTEVHTHLQLRMYPLEALLDAFARAGFRVVAQAHDFQGSPLPDTPLKWVGVLAPTR